MDLLFDEEHAASVRLASIRAEIHARVNRIPVLCDQERNLRELFKHHLDDEPNLVASLFEFMGAVCKGFSYPGYSPPESFEISDPVLRSLCVRHEVEVLLCRDHPGKVVYEAASGVFIPMAPGADISAELSTGREYRRRIAERMKHPSETPKPSIES